MDIKVRLKAYLFIMQINKIMVPETGTVDNSCAWTYK